MLVSLARKIQTRWDSWNKYTTSTNLDYQINDNYIQKFIDFIKETSKYPTSHTQLNPASISSETNDEVVSVKTKYFELTPIVNENNVFSGEYKLLLKLGARIRIQYQNKK